MTEKNIYEELFTTNKGSRVEYGNTQNSFEYVQHLKIKKDSKILDVGTNIGTLPHKLFSKGWKKVYGIDVSPSAINFGKQKYTKISKNLKSYEGKKFPYSDNTFDVIMAFDVIEHIKNPSTLLDEIYRVLKPNGIFIFQTPNKIINSCWETLQSKSLTSWRKYHCSLQTKKSLNKLLKKSRFNDIQIEKYSIVTDYNKEKVRKKIGRVFIPLLYLLNVMPLQLSPNLWGTCKK